MAKNLLNMIAGAALGTAMLSMNANAEEKSKIEPYGSLSIGYFDSYTVTSGAEIGRSVFEGGTGVIQDTLALGARNVFMKNDDLCFTIWSNTDPDMKHYGKNNPITEVDIGPSYSFSLGKVFNGDLRANMGAHGWLYPNGFEGKYDIEFEGGLSWNGPISLNANAVHILQHDRTDQGTYVVLGANKSLNLGNVKGWNFSLTPSLSACWNDMFQDYSSWAVVMPRADLSMSKGNATISAGAGYQFSLDKGKSEKKNKPVFSTAITWAF